MDTIKIINVIMKISPRMGERAQKASDNASGQVWHVKFDRDIIQIIQLPIFQFSSTSLNVAVTKVADLVARHPENYFSEINIK